MENRAPVLSSHPDTCYLCKEKRRYYPRIEGIGDHEKVQGHPQRFLETPIPSATQPTSPTLWISSVGTYTQKAGEPTPVPRAGERMYVPTRRKRKGEGSGRQVPGADDIPSKYGEPEGFSWKHKREKKESAYEVGCRFLLEMPKNNDPTSLPQSLST